MRQIFRSSSALLLALCLGLSARAGAAESTPPTAVDLLSAGNYLVLTGAGIQDQTSSVVFIGDIGTSPIAGSGITGVTTARVTGSIYCVDASGPAGAIVAPALLSTAKGDLTTAYNDAFGRVLARVTQAPELGGLTLAPGLYWSAAGFSLSTGDLILDPGLVPNAVWIFQAGTAASPTDVIIGTTRSVILTNGALASNVFWACRSASLDTSTSFAGIILADQSITNAGSSHFEGRQLAFAGNATFNGASFTGVGVPGSFAAGSPTVTVTASPTATVTPSPTLTQTPGGSVTRTVTPVVSATPSPTEGPSVPGNGGSYIYPSPSTGSSARIVYTMTGGGSVRIRIYNDAGRLVDSIDEDKPVGFQGSQISVDRFASGSYYYVLTQVYAGSTSVQSTRKFVVLH